LPGYRPNFAKVAHTTKKIGQACSSSIFPYSPLQLAYGCSGIFLLLSGIAGAEVTETIIDEKLLTVL
jgi:hypothetical protein